MPVPQIPNLGRGLAYIAEPAAVIGSSLLGEAAGGLGALATADPSNVERIHHALTYQPRTESGRAGLADIGGLLSDAGGLAMDTPYLGAGIRNFGESRESLIDAGYPGLAAALQTAPAAVATLFAPEARGAFSGVGGEIGSTIASGGNLARSGMAAGQRGFIKPSAFVAPINKAFKLSRAAKAATGTLAGERAAQRIGSGLERTHKGYVAEKTAAQEEDNGGRNLLAKH